MKQRLPDIITTWASRCPDAPAISYERRAMTYGQFACLVEQAAKGYLELGLERADRVAVYLEKRFDTVIALFAAAAAGGVFVPINPLLKAPQVDHILRDCDVRILVTSKSRLEVLREVLPHCTALRVIVVVDSGMAGGSQIDAAQAIAVHWNDLVDLGASSKRRSHRVIDIDMSAILYTSGSTGKPKGVVLSHRNLLAGAESVSSYLENTATDRILAVLPLSFDAGFSQLTTAFNVGAKVVLMNYLLPIDVVRLCSEEQITGLTCVPPLWIQLAEQDWPADAASHMRYFANTGGHMPEPILAKLRQIFVTARPYLMYGLTEAFRSTYLDPSEVDARPGSIGKAVPHAEVLVVRKDGSLCAAGEVGELVHRGPFVALGYWNDPEKTAERFRPAPSQASGICTPEIAVWSGDYVRADEEEFLYFIGRHDEMIKTSGYRVSPTELEEVIYGSGLVGEAVALGVPHPKLGQAIVVAATGPDHAKLDVEALVAACRAKLPNYMVPQRIVVSERLPRNANGKIDRQQVAREFCDLFES